jgi:hypothetical protein
LLQGRVFSFLIRKKKIIEDQLECFKTKNIKATHLAKERTQKLTLLKTLEAFQSWKASNKSLILAITLAKFQPKNKLGFLIAKIM